uniref:VWFA domain-containing protein n=1 Tax=Globodera rostochiensis TaxID=31243 RepID=A0A914IFZ5_GLORO
MIICSILIFLLISLPSILSQSSTNQTVDEQDDCATQSKQSTTLRVVVLFDITPEYATNFRNQQLRLIKSLRHIDQRAKGQPRFYALVAFHRTSVVLSGLNYAQAKNVEKIIDEIHGLNPRRRLETAPSKAFETAEELLEYHQKSLHNTSSTINIVLLVHDGLNTDTRNETFDAIAKLSKIEAGIFAIAGSVKPNEQILTEYTGLRSHVFASNDDMEHFFEALDNKIDPCTTAAAGAELRARKFPIPTKLRDDKNRTAVEVLLLAENDSNAATKQQKLTPKQEQQFVKREQSFLAKELKLEECNNAGKIDLMLLLDTSGSMYLSFTQQRQLALQLLHAIEPALHALQVGVIQFAHEPTVIHSLREPTATKYRELLDRVRDIVFTGRNTRIADALELALNEFDKHGRKDAQKVLVLISDGHGQEFWHRAAEVAHRLQSTRYLQRFAVSSSLDYNFEELMLYMGDQRRVFVGQRTFVFMPTIVAFLNKCLPNSVKKISAMATSSDDIGITNGTDSIVSTVETTTTVDEFTTVANLSEMLREADNNGMADTLSHNLTSPTSSGLAEEFVSNSTLALLKQNETEAPSQQNVTDTAIIGKREKLVNETTTAEKLENGTLADNERDEPLKAEEEDDENGEAKTDEKEKLKKIELEKKKPTNPAEFECDTDVLIMLDRSRPEQSFAQQIALAKHLIVKIDPEEIALGKIRVGIISFGAEAKKETEWREKLTRRQILQKLDTIQQYNGQTSFVQAAKVAIEEVSKIRRPGARMLAAMFWSGSDGIDQPDELAQAINELHMINQTQLFAVSLSPKANLTRLKELAGDQWHVFVEGRANQFVGQASRYLLDCVLPPSDALFHRNPSTNNNEPSELDNHEPLNSVERVEHLQAAARAFKKQPLGSCKNDLVDLALLLHFRPQNGSSPNDMSGQFHAMIRAAMDALRQAPADQYLKRIRLSLLINAQVQVSLKTAIDLDDALFALDRAQLDQAEIDGTVALANKLQMSLDDLRHFHRDGARVVILVLSNDEQQQLNADEQQSRLIIKGLDRLSASLFILHFAPRGANAPKGTLSAQFNGSDSERTIRVFSTSGKISHFVDEFRRKTFMCRRHDEPKPIVASPNEDELVASDSALPPSEEFEASASSSVDASTVNETDTSSGAVKLLENDVSEKQPQNNNNKTEQMNESKLNLRTNNMADAKPDNITVTTTTTLARSSTRKAVKFALNDDDHPRVFLLGDECKVDLMFIIDTSQSVQEAFDEQLKFAVDLVKRLPDQDFAQRVQVGAVSFYKKAQVQFSLGELKEKSAILDSLLHINHTGGGTSVVSGVDLAMDEVVKTRRKGTRLMVVLITDGSSQDPWADVVRSADRLRAAEADVYTITVSHDYFFRELELYAGNKWFVYIDARIRQFLDEAEISLVECKSPSMPMQRAARDEKNGSLTALVPQSTNTLMNFTTEAPSSTSSSAAGGSCEKDMVDLMFIIDTSASVQKEFYAEKNFALDLVRVLPEQDFTKRISIAMVKFRGTADIHFHFHPGRRREDIIYDIERVEHTGGETSLATAAELAYREIFRLRRPDARLIVVIITDGNSQDEWKDVKVAAKKLRASTGGNGIYAVTLSEKYSVEELREYTGTEDNLYTNHRIDQFIQEVGNSISRCPDGERDGIKVTPVPDVEASTTPSSTSMLFELMNSTVTQLQDKHSVQTKIGQPKKHNKEDEVAKARDENPIRVSREEELFDEALGSELFSKCNISKMDVIIILDASTSRENVFEHQRELALSLIERLPINREDPNVATGIISFTNSPVLRQTLGLGRDRKMVRKSIEDIKYRGGSTLTSKAVELALQDMRRGMRSDARQVVVLMNDGMSQDLWEQVLESSRNLANSGADRFGVALGSEVDLRELHHYIGTNDRIYRDGSTERFLRDIVALLGETNENCTTNSATVKAVPIHRDEKVKMPLNLMEIEEFEFQLDSHCEKPNVDLLIMLDNVISSERNNDNLKLNSNRYLLLDVLGSLPWDGRVHVALISAGGPRLEYRLEDLQNRDAVATRVERVRPLNGAPDYASSIARALDHYTSARRDNARGILLLVGNGNGTTDSLAQRQNVVKRIRQTQGLSCIAVDSGKEVIMKTLIEYTGSPQRVFPFERNAEFAKILFDEVTASEQCQSNLDQKTPNILGLLNENGTEVPEKEGVDFMKRFSLRRQRLRDIGLSRLDKEDKVAFDDDKLVNKHNEKKKDDSLALLLASIRHEDESTTSSATVVTSQGAKKPSFMSSTFLPPFRSTLSATTPDFPFEIQKHHRIRIQKPFQNDERATGSSSSTTTTLTTSTTINTEPYRPGCLIDLMLIIDASGSVHAAFEQEKMLASQIIQQIRVGPNNSRVTIVKFASTDTVLDVIKNMTFSDGTTAIHSALHQAVIAYSALHGARPGLAEPIAVVFTDGFGQHEFSEQATLLRQLVPRVYALAVHDGIRAPIARAELTKITGDARRVFTAATVTNLYGELRERFRGC